MAENQGTDGLPLGLGGDGRRQPRPDRVASAPTDFGESGDDNVNVYTPPQASDGVVSVLQDMFSIFGKKKQPASKAARGQEEEKSLCKLQLLPEEELTIAETAERP